MKVQKVDKVSKEKGREGGDLTSISIKGDNQLLASFGNGVDELAVT